MQSPSKTPDDIMPRHFASPQYLLDLFASEDPRSIQQKLDSVGIGGVAEFLLPVFERLKEVPVAKLQDAIRKELDGLFLNLRFITIVRDHVRLHIEKNLKRHHDEHEFEGVLNTSIHDLGLSIRARKAMIRKGCTKLGHLVAMTGSQFMLGQRQCGEQTFNEIVTALYWHDLDFKPEQEETS